MHCILKKIHLYMDPYSSDPYCSRVNCVRERNRASGRIYISGKWVGELKFTFYISNSLEMPQVYNLQIIE